MSYLLSDKYKYFIGVSSSTNNNNLSIDDSGEKILLVVIRFKWYWCI